MKKYTLLIPRNYNSGADIPAEDIAAFLQQLLAAFGGYTKGGEVSGAWIDQTTGKAYHDRLLKVWFATRDHEAVIPLLDHAAELFKQQAIYCDCVDCQLLF